MSYRNGQDDYLMPPAYQPHWIIELDAKRVIRDSLTSDTMRNLTAIKILFGCFVSEHELGCGYVAWRISGRIIL
jgi:hypothetical protein